jgi:hypothetical protein
MDDTGSSDKPKRAERGERRARRTKGEADGNSESRSRLKYIKGRLVELKAERAKLREEKKLLQQSRRGEAKPDAPEA